jgi:vacuolar-type H+-ATPase subunit I/STV1
MTSKTIKPKKTKGIRFQPDFLYPLQQKSLSQKKWIIFNKKITGIDLSKYFCTEEESLKKYRKRMHFDFFQANEDYDFRVLRVSNKCKSVNRVQIDIFPFQGLHKYGIRIRRGEYILYSNSVIVVPVNEVMSYKKYLKESWEKHKEKEGKKEEIRFKKLMDKKKEIDEAIDKAIKNIIELYQWEEFKKKVFEEYPHSKFDIEEELKKTKKKIEQNR